MRHANLDMDVGDGRTRDASLPICELEIELERGNSTRLFGLALALNDGIGLRFASVALFWERSRDNGTSCSDSKGFRPVDNGRSCDVNMAGM
jgi:hypothetical protein